MDLFFNIFVNENKHPLNRYMVWEIGPMIQATAKIKESGKMRTFP